MRPQGCTCYVTAGRGSNGCVRATPCWSQRHRRVAAGCRHATPQGRESPPVKGVIFDVDGVLCSTEHLSRQAAADVLRRLYGVRAAPDEFIPFGGMGEERFLGGVAEKYGVAGFDVEEAKPLFLKVYIETYTRGPQASTIAFPGAVELVRALRAAGMMTAVASSAARAKVDANLRAAGFGASDFGCVISGADFERNKPFPDVFLAAASALGLPPAECVVVEDAAAGVQAARAAGMRVVGVTTTLPAMEMEAEGPDAVFGDVTGLAVADLTGLEFRPRGAAARQAAGAEQ